MTRMDLPDDIATDPADKESPCPPVGIIDWDDIVSAVEEAHLAHHELLTAATVKRVLENMGFRVDGK